MPFRTSSSGEVAVRVITEGASVPRRPSRLGGAPSGLLSLAAARSLAFRAFVGSRVLVLVVGAGGVLVPTRVVGMFNSARGSPQLGTFGNVLAASSVRFDSGYYLDIARQGYPKTTGGPVFFPLYPLLIRVLSFLTGSEAVAGIAISMVSFGVALVLLHRLTELELGKGAADATVLLMAFAPLSFFFSAVYTESLFLVLSVAAILAARNERWALAGALGALATLTRVTGILLVLPIVIMLWRSPQRVNRRFGWVLLLPAALAGYLAYLAAQGLPWLAPFREEGLWSRVAVGPIGGIAAGLKAAVSGLAAIVSGAHPIYAPTLWGPFTKSAQSVLLLVVLVLAAVALVSCVRRLPMAYGAYAWAALLTCVSSPMIGRPLISLDRYTLTIFPLWMAAGAWIAKRRLTRPAVLIGAALLVFYTFWFSRGAFVA